MRKVLLTPLAVAGLILGSHAYAAVTVTAGPTSLVTSPVAVSASSGQLGLFSFTVNQTAGETLSQVSVLVSNAGTSTASSADLASVSVYRDGGDGLFNPGTDLLAGSQTTVNIGSATTITTSANNSLDAGGTKFFVSLATAASWSSAASPVDSVTVTLPADGIATSASSPTVTAATTSTITADSVSPSLVSAVALNTGGTIAKEAGDSIEFTFNEATAKPALTAAQVASTFTLNNSHSLLDGASAVGSATWNTAGTMLTVTLSSGTSLPTVTIGDTVTLAGTLIQDAVGNSATGSTAVTGTFVGTDTVGPILLSAVAQNTGGTGAKEAGDSVVLVFGEATTKPAVTSGTIATALMLNNGHSWLDGAGAIGSATWNAAGTVLTITLSGGTSLPTVSIGDVITAAGVLIKDTAGNTATGTVAITGAFSGSPTPTPTTGQEINLKNATITTVGASSITVVNGSATYTVNVTAKTKIMAKRGVKLELADLAAGDTVKVNGRLTSAGVIEAKKIDDQSLKVKNASFTGVIQSINSGTRQFVLDAGARGTITVTVNDGTRITSPSGVATFANLEPDQQVTVQGVWNRTANTLIHTRKVIIHTPKSDDDEDDNEHGRRGLKVEQKAIKAAQRVERKLEKIESKSEHSSKGKGKD